MAKTIRHNEDNTASYWGQEDHLEVAKQRTFTEMVFELLTEKPPSPQERQLFDLILNLSIDHGGDTPSAQATIQSARDGKNISDAVAAGVSQINDTHGGAIEPAMRLFYRINKDQLDIPSLVKEYLDQKKLLSGFGHRIYTVDPRSQLILKKLEESNLGSEFINAARQIEGELEAQKGRKLPLNIDGAIAVVLCAWGWDPKLAKSVFIIARTPGLCGQYLNNT